MQSCSMYQEVGMSVYVSLCCTAAAMRVCVLLFEQQCSMTAHVKAVVSTSLTALLNTDMHLQVRL